MFRKIWPIVLWISFIVLFVVFYRFFNTDTGSGLAKPTQSPSSLAIMMVVVFPLVFGFFLWRAKKVEKLNLAGLALLAEGRHLEALQIFQKMPNSSVSFLNAGVAQFGLWRVADAEASFARVMAKRTFFDRSIRHLTASPRALASALLGRGSDAASQLAECDAMQVGTTPVATLARAVLEARAGAWTQTRELLDRPAINELGGRYRGLAEALKAWAAEEQSEPARDTLDRIALFPEIDPEAFREIWPGFYQFLDRHKPLAA